MPGLIRGVARTAVVAGTATTVANRVSRRQANRWAAEDQQAATPGAPPRQYDPPPQAGAAAPTDPVAQLKGLAELRSQGVLTDEEFAAQKARILAG